MANKQYILEFSFYPYPIGRNQTNIICWEWRWGWLHYQMQANRYLLDQLKKRDQRIAELELRLRMQIADTHYEQDQVHDMLRGGQ